jgi:preprotein translocase subunit SecG
MKTSLFLALVLLSGFSAGTIHGLTNLVIVEPFLDSAIAIENQNLFASGEAQDTPSFWIEYDAYRTWQKGGQVLAGAILGTSVGALFGIVFAYSRNALPSGHSVKKTLTLASLMWAILFLIPFLKYPANPPTVGDPETIVLRSAMYLGFIALSGFGALGFYKVYKKLLGKKKILAFAGYAVYITVIFALMPPNPDEITAPMELVNGFRSMSFVAVTIFWIANAIILGLLWQKYNPDKKLETKIS